MQLQSIVEMFALFIERKLFQYFSVAQNIYQSKIDFHTWKFLTNFLSESLMVWYVLKFRMTSVTNGRKIWTKKLMQIKYTLTYILFLRCKKIENSLMWLRHVHWAIKLFKDVIFHTSVISIYDLSTMKRHFCQLYYISETNQTWQTKM